MRKTTVAIVAACAAAAISGWAGEIREVNGRTVDLEPLVTWYSLPLALRHGTPRPLPHWKWITIDKTNAGSARPGEGNRLRCEVTMDDGIRKEIWLTNVPLAEVTRCLTIPQLDSMIASLSSVTNSIHQGPGLDGFNTAQRMRAAKAREVRDLMEMRWKLAEEIRGCAVRTYAMRSGATRAGLEVWDCGICK